MLSKLNMIIISMVFCVVFSAIVSWKITKKYYQGEVSKYKLEAQAWEQVAKRMEEDIKSGAKYRIEVSIVREKYFKVYYNTQQCFDKSAGNGTECMALLKEEMLKMRGEILGKK